MYALIVFLPFFAAVISGLGARWLGDRGSQFITTAFVEKEYAKIVNEQGDWNSKLIPQLLEIVYHELVTEEIWNICKKFKNPTINFKTLNNMTINKIKSIKPEIFG